MAPTFSIVPGSDVPIRQPKAAQLRVIRARAAASAEIVDVLRRLAFGEREDIGQAELAAVTPSWAGPVVREAAHA